MLMGDARLGSRIPEPITCLLWLLGSAPGIRQRAYVTLGNVLTLSKSQLHLWKMEKIIVSSGTCPEALWAAFQGHLTPGTGINASPPPPGEHRLHKGVLSGQTGESGEGPWGRVGPLGKKEKILRVKEGREHESALCSLDLRPVFEPLDRGGEIGS